MHSGPTSITLDLPLPPRILHPNGRTMRPNYLRTVRRKYRAMAGDEAWVQHPDRPKHEAARITLSYFTKSGRGQDPDNLIAWAKAAIDGLLDAGIIDDDNKLTYEHPTVAKDSDRPRLVILVDPIEGDHD